MNRRLLMCPLVPSLFVTACSGGPVPDETTALQKQTATTAAASQCTNIPQPIQPTFTQCPAIGADKGCAILLVVDPDGSLRALTDPKQGPYDGVEDTLIGVVNLSSRTVQSIPLSGSQPIFDFDGDGICAYDPAHCGTDSSGYAGPGVTFSVSSSTAGTVNFSAGLGPCQSAYFSLEEAVELACPDVPVARISQYAAPWGCHRYANHTDALACAGGSNAGKACSIDTDCGTGAQCCVSQGLCEKGSKAGQACSSSTDCPKGKCKKNTIRALGCALTSATMLINTAGGHLPGGGSVTPQNLNDWLKSNGGYDASNAVKWYALPKAAANFGASLTYTDPPTNSAGTPIRDDFTLDQYLCGGSPTILAQPGHFVVATGRRTTTSCPDDYAIADPGYDRADLDNKAYNCNYKSLRLEQRGGTSLQALYVRVHSPVEVLLTDPNGAVSGVDPGSGQSFGGIPSSSYYSERIDNDEDPDLSGEPEVKLLEVHRAINGAYRLHLLGTAAGPFTLEVDAISAAGTLTNSVWTGVATLGSDNGYTIDYASGSANVVPDNRPPDCHAATATPTALWPPDHRSVAISIAGVSDPDGDPTTTFVTGVTQNEITSGSGSDDQCPDASGVGASIVTLRSERAGSSNGRTYDLAFTASDGRGGQCQGHVEVCVPHDSAHPACSGPTPTIDSTLCSTR